MRNLWICIPCRNRTVLTEKTIDSIYYYTKHFDHIHIYLFDNYSQLDTNRLTFIQRMINEKKITHYSYDTGNSSHNIFPKIIIHQRWDKMMKLMLEVADNCENSFFVLCDNDALFGPEWDTYLLSASQFIDKKYPKISYLTAYPGGIPTSGHRSGKIEQCSNIFNRQNFDLLLAKEGGSSLFWFMNTRMLKKFDWPISNIKDAKNRFKTHDSGAWKFIRKQNPSYYVAAVKSPHPIMLHLGSIIGGSICNALDQKIHSKRKKYNEEEENNYIDIPVKTMYEQLKNKCNKW